jgi:hypothetical protein
MKRTYLFSFFLFLSLFQILVLNTNYANAASDESVEVELNIKILDVDPRTKLANVKIHVSVPIYPYNRSQINVYMSGGGAVIVTCENEGFNRRVDGWFYDGESNQTSWYLEGTGETYPFNSYSVHFEVQSISLIGDNDFSLIPEKVYVRFSGPNYLYLKNSWIAERVLTPEAQITTKEVIFSLEKTSNAFITDVLYSLVPIIACYYLLGATLILNPRNKLGERLEIYLALFVFSSTYLIAIQPSLPFHSSITFPELLLSNLTVSIAIFGIFSILGSKPKKPWDFPKETDFPVKWDGVASILALMIFIILYTFTLLGKLNTESSVIFTYVVIPSYVLAYFFSLPKREITKHKIRWILLLIFVLFPLELLVFIRIITSLLG